jgi:hypothetical protein
MTYWLLTTHGAAFFPIGVFLWSWKRRKDPASIFMLIKFLYCVTYSLLYHSHHSLGDKKFTSDIDYKNWALLDGYASASLIFTTVLYGLRVREPQFYITSFAVENLVLVFYLWYDIFINIMITTWYLTVCSVIVLILKWKTAWRYILKFKCLSFLTISCGIIALTMFIMASDNWHHFDLYIKYHSLWHCFIFATAGFAALLRFKLDEELYPIRNRRDQLDSI